MAPVGKVVEQAMEIARLRAELATTNVLLLAARAASGFDTECLGAGYNPAWVRNLIDDRAALQLEVERLRAELADALDGAPNVISRMTEAEAAIGRVRELCSETDEAGNGGLRTWQVTDAIEEKP